MLKLALITFVIALLPGVGSFTGITGRGKLIFRMLFGFLLAITILFLAVGLLAGEALF